MGRCCVTQEAHPGALWQPRGVRWGRWEGGSRRREPKEGTLSPLSWVAARVVVLCSADSLRLYGLKPIRFLCPWDFPGKDLEWVAIPSPGDLPDLGIEPSSLTSPALAGGSFTTEPLGKPRLGLESSLNPAADQAHISCVALCKPPTPSEPQFIHLWNGDCMLFLLH